ncbi:hypothetical protein [Modestobacter excelsi]|uniref:hypothetical protein n=1 Tax=Modestobacter excelsi TaxID=2213161 RepID=UPI00110CDE6A|nr:hypothetical protein [Modestobacter excelsi]
MTGEPPRPRGGRSRVGDFPTLVEEARAWPAVLEALEGDVYEAEETLARGRADEIAAWGRRSTDWIPPSNLGPLPDDLRERATRLLQHQLAVAEQLVERITQSQKQRNVAARMSYAPTRPVASYVDRAM